MFPPLLTAYSSCPHFLSDHLCHTGIQALCQQKSFTNLAYPPADAKSPRWGHAHRRPTLVRHAVGIQVDAAKCVDDVIFDAVKFGKCHNLFRKIPSWEWEGVGKTLFPIKYAVHVIVFQGLPPNFLDEMSLEGIAYAYPLLPGPDRSILPLRQSVNPCPAHAFRTD